MGVLTEIPHPDNFIHIPYISQALGNYRGQSDIHHKIKSLGQIFVKHGVHPDFGVILLHRHFDLKEQEIMVETMSEDNVYSSAVPWKVTGGNTAYPSDEKGIKCHLSEKKNFIVPASWYFGSDGSLRSYEFISDCQNLPHPPQPFLTELHNELERMGCSELFGIRRLGQLRYGLSWEISPRDVRTNLTKFGSEMPTKLQGEVMNTVVWSFLGNGDVRSAADCSSSQGQVDALYQGLIEETGGNWPAYKFNLH